MDQLAQLQEYGNDLTAAIEALVSYGPKRTSVQQNQPLIPPDSCEEVLRTQASILSNIAKIKTLVYGSTDFLKHLTSQSEILACLRWLGEFQILACIPLVGSVPIKDVAALSGVPKTHLARIIRFTATAAFLDEPQPGNVAHTPLSASFVTNPSFLDAAMFLAESVAPVALQMATATQKSAANDLPRSQGSAYNLALNTAQPFHAAREERPRLGRQWSAYLDYAAGLRALGDETIAVLAQLNWSNINGIVVEVGVASVLTSIARNLAARFPALQILVQINADGSAETPTLPELGSNIAVSNRMAGLQQTIINAAVYILHLTPALPFCNYASIATELQIHLKPLRLSRGVMLILTPHLLPKLGSIANPEVEAMARARDLTLLQLANEGEMEMDELLELIDSVSDSSGKLVVTNKLCSQRNNLIVVLVIKYRSRDDS